MSEVIRYRFENLTPLAWTCISCEHQSPMSAKENLELNDPYINSLQTKLTKQEQEIKELNRQLLSIKKDKESMASSLIDTHNKCKKQTQLLIRAREILIKTKGYVDWEEITTFLEDTKDLKS
jgi:septal ring factor EnvC (AmiA/AmiB activator)